MPRQEINHWKFELIGRSKKKDVTREYLSLIKQDLLDTSNNNIYQFKNLNFSTDEFNYLRITNPKNKYWRPTTIKKGTPFSLFTGNLSFKSEEIDIVYFVNTKISPQYKNLFRDQLKQLIKSEDNRLIFYFHGKGLSYMKNKFVYIRQPIEKLIFKLLIDEWEKNLETFKRFNSIDKIGILSGGNGWLWFNFWIAKSSYIKGLQKPIKTKRACYYEDWLGRTLVGNKKVSKEEINSRNFLYTMNQTFSILNNPKKNKYNIGTTCKVERGGFVGLGLSRYTYKIWYLIYKYLNRFLIRK